PIGNERVDGRRAPGSLEDARIVEALRDPETQRTSEKEGADVDEIETLAVLETRVLLVDVTDRKVQIRAVKRRLSRHRPHKRGPGLSAQRQVRGKIQQPIPDLLRREVLEKLVDAELHQAEPNTTHRCRAGEIGVDMA